MAQWSKLPPREHRTLSESLAAMVADLIRRNELGPGEKLPTVKELAREFKVATPTMREALQRLEATGVVEIRHGSGVYIKRQRDQVMLPNPYFGALELETVLDLCDARLVIEPELAAAATGNATPAALAELAALLEEAERHLPGDDDLALSRANMGFHKRIAALSGNDILAQFIASLIELYGKEQLAILYIYDDRRQDHQEHRLIFEAMRDRDAERARSRMHGHLRGVREVLAERLKGGEA